MSEISEGRRKTNNQKLDHHYLISIGPAMFLLIISIPLLVFVSAKYYFSSFSVFQDLIKYLSNQFNFKLNIILVTSLCSSFMAFLTTLCLKGKGKGKGKKIYLVDFSCYKPEPEIGRMCSRESFMERAILSGSYTEENLSFQNKILERSGLGQNTYLPKACLIHTMNPSMENARKETEMTMFGAIDELLDKTGVKVEEIGILVVNSSLFNPSPCLSSVIVNRYKLNHNIQSFNLGGMSCSASIISIDLVKQLLQVHPNAYALVVSTENITLNWYLGNDKSMLVSNCLFRMGGSAILLSNRPSDRCRSKYELIHTVRIHKGTDDEYNCVFQQEDDNKNIGVRLSKTLMAVAGESLKTNIITLAPLVLPVSEMLLFIATRVAKKVLKKAKNIKPYIPDFKLVFEHFCIHAGGRAVLDEVEKSLELSDWHMEPSRMTLYRFGNTSSSSLWYTLAYTEAKGRIKKGDRTWQIAFGAGYKCNSAVWRALKTIDPLMEKNKNPWMDEIHEFPVEVPKRVSIVRKD